MSTFKTYQKIIGGMVLGGVVYMGVQLAETPPDIPCDTPTGTMVWNLPTDFNTSEDTIMIFAKKEPLKYQPTDDGVNYTPKTKVTRINIDVPTKRPGLYGSPDTNLANIEGGIPIDIQYEHDELAMLVYADTGNFLNIVGLEDTTYVFASFRTDNGAFSNATYSRGQTIAIDRIYEIVLANSSRLQWIIPICYETDTVIAVLSTDSIDIVPNGYASNYLYGIELDYNLNIAYFNGIDDTDGKVMHLNYNLVDRLLWSNLPEEGLWVFFWVNRGDCWSKATYKKFDTR